MKVLFMVRREYFDAIKAGTKKEEIRKATTRWRTLAAHGPRIGFFVCGKDVHKREITSISVVREGAVKVLKRELSEQGKKDVGEGPVVVFWLGDEVKD